MRLRKKIIDHVAKTVADRLFEQGLLTADGARETIMAEVGRLIRDDLMVEDRLNEEVKELLRAYSTEIERGNVDYARMFSMVKRKLVQERGLIL